MSSPNSCHEPLVTTFSFLECPLADEESSMGMGSDTFPPGAPLINLFGTQVTSRRGVTLPFPYEASDEAEILLDGFSSSDESPSPAPPMGSDPNVDAATESLRFL